MLVRSLFVLAYVPILLFAAPDESTEASGADSLTTLEVTEAASNIVPSEPVAAAAAAAEATDPSTVDQADDADEGPFESLIKKCDGWPFPEESFAAQPDVTKVYLKVDKMADGPFKDQNLTKFASVFGIRIIGDEPVPDKKVLHVANAMVKIIDADNDGKADNKQLLEELRTFHPTLFIMKDAERIMSLMNAQNADEGFPLELKFCPFAFDFEEAKKIHPGGGRGDATCEAEPEDGKEANDRTMAFVLDHLMGRGFGAVMGPDRESKLQEIYKESLEAGTFEPENTGCPPESDECGRVMFASWGLSTILGFDTCWCEQAHALKFCHVDALKKGEPELVELLKDVFPDITKIDESEYNPKDKANLIK